MSYSLQVYLIDMDQLKNVMGSNSTSFVDLVWRACGTRMAGDYGETPSLSEAVKEIVSGQVTYPACGSQYGYALEMICGVLGDQLPSGAFAASGADLIADVEIADPMMEDGGLPIPIPEPEDFPWIGHLTAEQAAAEYEKLKDADLTDDEAEVEDAREQYVDWLREATEKGKGIVAFYY